MKRQYNFRNTTFACYRAYITQAIINNIAPLLFIIFSSSFGISYEQLGLLVVANFATQLLTDLWAAKYADRVGYRRCMIAAHGLSAIGLLLLGTLPLILPNPYVGLFLAVSIYAVGGGLLEVLVSPIVEALPIENKEASMSLLHSFYSWGQLFFVIISTLFIWLIGKELWYLLPILWSLFPLYNMFRFFHVPLLPLVTEGRGMKLRELFSSPGFYLALIFMVSAGASELSMSQWSSIFAEKGLGVPKLIGDLLGPGFFAFFMMIGRTIYGIYGGRMPIKASLIVSSSLCVLTYLVTIFSTNPLLSLFSCSLTGLAISLMWPGTFSLTQARFPKGGTLMFGLLAVFGDLGGSIGPWLAGRTSDSVTRGEINLSALPVNNMALDQLGLRAGLLVNAAFPLLMLFGLLLYRSRRRT